MGMTATFQHLMKLFFELKKVARLCNSVGPRLLCVFVSVTPLPPVLIYHRVAMGASAIVYSAGQILLTVTCWLSLN